MYRYQTLDLVKEKRKEYAEIKKQKNEYVTLNMLDAFVDPSDPDLKDITNSNRISNR